MATASAGGASAGGAAATAAVEAITADDPLSRLAAEAPATATATATAVADGDGSGARAGTGDTRASQAPSAAAEDARQVAQELQGPGPGASRHARPATAAAAANSAAAAALGSTAGSAPGHLFRSTTARGEAQHQRASNTHLETDDAIELRLYATKEGSSRVLESGDMATVPGTRSTAASRRAPGPGTASSSSPPPAAAADARPAFELPLSVFEHESTLVVSRRTLMRSPFFRQLFATSWGDGRRHVAIGLPTIRFMAAFVDAIRCMERAQAHEIAHGANRTSAVAATAAAAGTAAGAGASVDTTVTDESGAASASTRGSAAAAAAAAQYATAGITVARSNMYELHAAAALLHMPSLQGVVEQHMVRVLSRATAVGVLRAAVRFRRVRLLRACLGWLVRTGGNPGIAGQADDDGSGGGSGSGSGGGSGSGSGGRASRPRYVGQGGGYSVHDTRGTRSPGGGGGGGGGSGGGGGGGGSGGGGVSATASAHEDARESALDAEEPPIRVDAEARRLVQGSTWVSLGDVARVVAHARARVMALWVPAPDAAAAEQAQQAAEAEAEAEALVEGAAVSVDDEAAAAAAAAAAGAGAPAGKAAAAQTQGTQQGTGFGGMQRCYVMRCRPGARLPPAVANVPRPRSRVTGTAAARGTGGGAAAGGAEGTFVGSDLAARASPVSVEGEDGGEDGGSGADGGPSGGAASTPPRPTDRLSHRWEDSTARGGARARTSSLPTTDGSATPIATTSASTAGADREAQVAPGAVVVRRDFTRDEVPSTPQTRAAQAARRGGGGGGDDGDSGPLSEDEADDALGLGLGSGMASLQLPGAGVPGGGSGGSGAGGGASGAGAASGGGDGGALRQWFELRRDTPGGPRGEGELVMLAYTDDDGAHYHLCSSRHDSGEFEGGYIGVVESNFLGTVFTVYDYGLPPDAPGVCGSIGEAEPRMRAAPHASVTFDTNVFGRVPNSMVVRVFPHARDQDFAAASDDGAGPDGGDGGRDTDGAATAAATAATATAATAAATSAAAAAARPDPRRGRVKLESKKPVWNAELDAWTMEFRGRVTLPSKKNCQLVTTEAAPGALLAAGGDAAATEAGAAGASALAPEAVPPPPGSAPPRAESPASAAAVAPRVTFLFGKVGRDRFNLDYAGPLSPATAFGIALSTFAGKLVVA